MVSLKQFVGKMECSYERPPGLDSEFTVYSFLLQKPCGCCLRIKRRGPRIKEGNISLLLSPLCLLALILVTVSLMGRVILTSGEQVDETVSGRGAEIPQRARAFSQEAG